MESAPTDEVVVEDRGAVRVLRINRPEARNALNGAVLGGIGGGIEAADADPAVRAIVITGTGDRAFCAGMDLRDFSDGSRESRDPDAAAAYVRFLRGGCAKPVVGAANATAVGGGLELLLGCDLVVASDQAEFGLPEVKRGLFAGGGGVRLGRVIPMAIALEIGLTGDRISAERALAFGLITRVVPAADVLDEAVALANRVAQNGPLGVQATKKLMYDALDVAPEELWERQAALNASVFGSDDAKEGALAFIEKREPNFTGH
jgi:enoyl-CoA hydratase/carnithine racemase